jgi:hypothetical protein
MPDQAQTLSSALSLFSTAVRAVADYRAMRARALELEPTLEGDLPTDAQLIAAFRQDAVALSERAEGLLEKWGAASVPASVPEG